MPATVMMMRSKRRAANLGHDSGLGTEDSLHTPANGRRGRKAISAFNRRFFANPMLWWCLSAGLGLQLIVVNSGPGQALFNVTSLSLQDWFLAAVSASSVLLFEEVRKLGARALHSIRQRGR